ncbi:GTP pyrophosphokinase [Rhodococcus koreensis]
MTSVTAREFAEELHAEYSSRRVLFESAQARLFETLVAIVSDRSRFTPSQQRRNRVERGRIKEPTRLLVKAQTKKYEEAIKNPTDVFEVLTDIVGTRITCNTVEDVHHVVNAIQAASTLRLPYGIPEDKCYEDYITIPKESGYRAIHLLVAVDVPTGSKYVPITCEVQVRTLLQHAWGELTHEDTFKPEIRVPPLVTALSKRLATTLAVLDEIAQDLRDELAKIEGEERKGGADGAEVPSEAAPSPRTLLHDDVLMETFEDIMGRSLGLNAGDRQRARRSLAVHEIQDRDSLAAALVMVRNASEAAHEETGGFLHDADYLAAAEKAPNEAAVKQSLLDRSRNFNEKLERSRVFYDQYTAGEVFVGTAVRVKPRYALIQLSTGDTATMSVRHIEGTTPTHLDMEDYVTPGASLQVEVVNSDFVKNRIEVRPVIDLTDQRERYE